MVTKYIYELLLLNDRVIIPGFGAFLKSKGKIENLIFNEFIKFNDGQLTNYVAEHEKVDVKVASERIDELVAGIKGRLENGERIMLENLGELYIDDQNRIRYAADITVNESILQPEKPVAPENAPADDKHGKQTPVATPAECVEISDGPIQEKPVGNAGDIKTSDDEIIKKIQPEIIEGQPQVDKKEYGFTKLNIELKPPVIGSVKPKAEEVKPVQEKKPEVKPSGKVNVQPIPPPVTPKPDVKEKPKITNKMDTQKQPPRPVGKSGTQTRGSKNNNTFIWLIVIIVPLLAIAAWVIFDYENVKSIFASSGPESGQVQMITPDGNQNKTGQDTTGMSATDAGKADSAATATNQGGLAGTLKADKKNKGTQDNKQDVKKKSTATGSKDYQRKGSYEDVTLNPKNKFHVIAGGFLYKENADNMVQDLDKKGYKSGIIGQFNGFYYVSACAFTSKTDAKIEENYLKKEGIEAWLYFYK